MITSEELKLDAASVGPFASDLIDTAPHADPLGAFARLVVAQQALIHFANPDTAETTALHDKLITGFMDLSARDKGLHGLCMDKMLISGIQSSAKCRATLEQLRAH